MKILRHLVVATVAVLAVGPLAPSSADAQVVEVIITREPPPRRVEVQYVSPGPEYVWHRGDWVFNPEITNYVWHPGHWVPRPDAEHSIWFPGDWVNFQGGWHYVPGHWRTPAEPPPPPYIKLVEVVREPPPPRAEIIPVLQPGYEWDPGHWSWDGADYRWVRGHWLFVPHEYHHWAPGHWARNGNFFFFHVGYWH
jgi:hypothetical protein